MAVIVQENGWVIDKFELGEEPFVLKDAIALPADEYYALSADELATMKQQRYDNWIAAVKAPPQE